MYVVCLYTDPQWLRGPRPKFAAAHLLGLWVRIPPATWVSLSCECRVLSGRGFCVGAIPRLGEFYRLGCATMWSWSLDNEEALAHWRMLRHGGKICVLVELFKMLLQSSSDFWVTLYRHIIILQGYYEFKTTSSHYRGADKSLARLGRKWLTGHL
jgi:hypothetical protein